MPEKICHISTVHPVYDNRILYKECRALAGSGYEVYLIVSHDREEIIDGVNIIPLPQKDGRVYRFFTKWWTALGKALKLKARIYHFHDPELITMGLILKILGKKVIYDVHEDVPAQILTKEWLGSPGLRRFISSFFNGFEKLFSRLFDGVVVVTTDIEKKFKKGNTVLVRNLPVTSIIEEAQPVNIQKSKPVIIYAGGLTRIRGIKELVEAVGIMKGKAELWLLGMWEDTGYEARCQSLEGWKHTRYFGAKPLEDVYSYMKCADIGFCTLYPVKNYLTSLPVKAFEYMACGLPMIMSDFPYWMEIFSGCSVHVDPKSPEDIAHKIQYILDDHELMKNLGDKGRELIRTTYSWDVEKGSLLGLYGRLSL